MKWVKEFRSFIEKGNVLDLAVAFVIGAAFKTVISTFVNDVLMPPIGFLLGGVDFSEMVLVLKAGQPAVMNGDIVVTPEIPEVAMRYGVFINSIVDLLIVGFALFLVVKSYNSMQKKKEAEPAAPPKPSNEEVLLADIRDLLSQTIGSGGKPKSNA